MPYFLITNVTFKFRLFSYTCFLNLLTLLSENQTLHLSSRVCSSASAKAILYLNNYLAELKSPLLTNILEYWYQQEKLLLRRLKYLVMPATLVAGKRIFSVMRYYN